MSIEEDNKTVVRRFYEEVFNQGQEAVIDEIVAPDYMDYGHTPPGKGPEGAKQDFRGIAGAFSNPHFTIDDLIATGDQVIARWTGTFTHTGEFAGVAPTGKSLMLTGMSIYRLANGQLLETRNAVNWMPLLQELGAIAG
jgi:predicted ester cyclase